MGWAYGTNICFREREKGRKKSNYFWAGRSTPETLQMVGVVMVGLLQTSAVVFPRDPVGV